MFRYLAPIVVGAAVLATPLRDALACQCSADAPAVDVEAARRWASFIFMALSTPVIAVLGPADGRKYGTVIYRLDPDRVSVVSDVDDTIKSSEVRNKLRLLARTFAAAVPPRMGQAPRPGVRRRRHRLSHVRRPDAHPRGRRNRRRRMVRAGSRLADTTPSA